jgi:RNA polymerase sigma factor (sigma-70 family)
MDDTDDLIPTRESLLSRLKDWQDAASWRQFFDLYWKLIFNTARRAGLSDSEAQDVVQETLLTVSKKIGKFRYDRNRGSFKNWLLNTTKWRIYDQFRKRPPYASRPLAGVALPSAQEGLTRDEILENDNGSEFPLSEMSQAYEQSLDSYWEADWQKNLMEGAIEQTKKLISPKHFQVFDLAVLREWPSGKIAASLNVRKAYVHLIKHRVSARVKKELRKLRDQYS